MILKNIKVSYLKVLNSDIWLWTHYNYIGIEPYEGKYSIHRNYYDREHYGYIVDYENEKIRSRIRI